MIAQLFAAFQDIFGLARMSYVENDQGLILEIVEWNAMTRLYFDGKKELYQSADKKQFVHEFNLADITPKGAVFVALAKYTMNKLLGRVQQTRRAVSGSLSYAGPQG